MISVYVTVKNKKLREDFRSSIDKSGFAKVTDTFDTLKSCREKLSTRLPHILLLGLDLQDGYWVDFCEEIRSKYPALKVLAVTSYDEYTVFRNALNSLTAGYISRDALPKAIVFALQKTMNDEFVRYEDMAPPVDSGSSEEVESNPEWLQTFIQQTIEKIEQEDNPQQAIEKLSMIIHATEKKRSMMIKNLLTSRKDYPDDAFIDSYLKQLIEYMLINGYSNWGIADSLGVSIDTVRLYRMEFITRLSSQHSVLFAINKQKETIKLGRRETQLLKLIAAGYTNQDIADKVLFIDIETVKTIRKNLLQKFEAKNTIAMIIYALRTGLLKMEDVEALLV